MKTNHVNGCHTYEYNGNWNSHIENNENYIKHICILSRGPPTAWHHCCQTLTIEHMLLECAVLQECRDEYYTVDSLNALFWTIAETYIVELLREVGFFYLILCNLLTSTSPETWTIWSDLNKLFREWKQLFRHIYLCRTANMSWRTRVVVQQIQSNQYFSFISAIDPPYIAKQYNTILHSAS